jgi:hypothetical protein
MYPSSHANAEYIKGRAFLCKAKELNREEIRASWESVDLSKCIDRTLVPL